MHHGVDRQLSTGVDADVRAATRRNRKTMCGLESPAEGASSPAPAGAWRLSSLEYSLQPHNGHLRPGPLTRRMGRPCGRCDLPRNELCVLLAAALRTAGGCV